jgi:hypothetical protein
MIEAILADVKSGIPVGIISAKFHNALAEGIRCGCQTCGPKPRGAFRRLFSESLFDGARGAAFAGGGLSAVLASACAAERWRDCAGTSRCCLAAEGVE